tara:strand:+ start:279 stop:464 length:186 start_codon:yes stop_codon:yes gene_type:complete
MHYQAESDLAIQLRTPAADAGMGGQKAAGAALQPRASSLERSGGSGFQFGPQALYSMGWSD